VQVASLPHFGGPEAFVLVDAPSPQPHSREVFVTVAAAGINRADVLQRQGNYPTPPDTPDWPGLEVSGVVAAMGSAVTRWKVGDSVCALLSGGGYAQGVTVHEDLVLPIPTGVDVIDAAGLVESACTVWSNLKAADAAAGQTLLVHGGAGGIGTMAIQFARAIGMQVIATAGGADRVQSCLDLGAGQAIDYRTEDFVEVVKASGGADVILDVVGAGYLERNLAALNPDGRLVVIGMQQGATAQINLGTLLMKRLSVIGTTLRSRPHAQKAAIVAAVEREVWPLIPDQVKAVTHARYPLSRVGDAHRELEGGGVVGKLLLLP